MRLGLSVQNLSANSGLPSTIHPVTPLNYVVGVRGLESGIRGLGFMVWGLGFGVWGFRRAYWERGGWWVTLKTSTPGACIPP